MIAPVVRQALKMAVWIPDLNSVGYALLLKESTRPKKDAIMGTCLCLVYMSTPNAVSEGLESPRHKS